MHNLLTLAMNTFLTALGDQKLEMKIQKHSPENIEVVFSHAVRIEAYEKALNNIPYIDNNRGRQVRSVAPASEKGD